VPYDLTLLQHFEVTPMNHPEHPAEHIDHTVDKAAFLRQLSVLWFGRDLFAVAAGVIAAIIAG